MKSTTILGDSEISGSRSTLRLGVNGSGSLMFLGKALSIRFLIWMQLAGITSQSWKWYLHRNSGKSWRRTRSILSVPLYMSLIDSFSSAFLR